MKKVITYGTFDYLHHGHLRLLRRAKELGDYLIVGVTSDDYDKTRGKINNQQSVMERILALKETGLADEVIVEEYEGQKIDDIRRCGVDIFAIGSDWQGKFDYLNRYCQVVYLPRTEGISSTEIRAERNKLHIGLVGQTNTGLTSLSKFLREVGYVNGVEVVCSSDPIEAVEQETDYQSLLEKVDAVYIASHPARHGELVRQALLRDRHVLCESPISLDREECGQLLDLARERSLILMEGIKTAYTTAYDRMILLAMTGKIGKVLSVDATCTSLKPIQIFSEKEQAESWNSIAEWGPPALLPVFQILGTDYRAKHIVTRPLKGNRTFDQFTKIDFRYEDAVASIKVAKAAKSEGELIITGTKGYIYVPAPWWKTDYFEVRFENPGENKRYFYQLDGEGIRYEIVAFAKAIETGKADQYVDRSVTRAICGVLQDFYAGTDTEYI